MVVSGLNVPSRISSICCKRTGPLVLYTEHQKLCGCLRCALMARHTCRGDYIFICLGNNDTRDPTGKTSTVTMQGRSLWADQLGLMHQCFW